MAARAVERRLGTALVVEVAGLDAAIDYFDEIPADVQKNLRRAVNATARRTRTRSAKAIREEVNFPARYLSGNNGRLTLKLAGAGQTEASIKGRFRPTSLARFSTSAPGSKRGVTVRVSPTNGARRMKRGFLMRLRSGAGTTDTKFNLGLAIRLKPGETITRKREMVALGKGLYLLYGPSVNQVFRTVAYTEAGPASEYLQQEFARLLEADID
jgi:hypothetical protein